MDRDRRTGFIWGAALAGIVLLALALRLKGIHDPLLDHPAWRQGDTASIARNFYRLNDNILYPQTNYDGPPPNYVELELQLVPYLAAQVYKVVGVHPVVGRLITIGFSVATVALLAFFGRWLFADALAGLVAAAAYAVFPGSVYYGRTFTPDTAMVFFLTAALYAAARLLVEDERLAPRNLARSTALLTLAYLAKPVALCGLPAVVAMIADRIRTARTVRPTAVAVLIAVPLVILWAYDRAVASHAEWHWASGIVRIHVLPALHAAFTSPAGFVQKAVQFKVVLGMLAHTMIGPPGAAAALVGACCIPWLRARSGTLLLWWLIGGLAYVYVVVTVERVDYYMYPLVPLAALLVGGLAARLVRAAEQHPRYPATLRRAAIAGIALFLLTALVQGQAAVAGYYRYSAAAYRRAVALDRMLRRNALVVMGYQGPDILYYIDRYGWEEDPYLWTPFDEESAIRKGARYFIDILDNRFRKNLELCAWMQRFPVLDARAAWPVYVTDPALVTPRARAFWRAFRAAERKGKGREFLDARGLCTARIAVSGKR
jgi:hypothetical protein